MIIRKLENPDFPDVMNCFNLAFSDYVIPLSVGEADFRRRLRRVNVQLSLSAGVFVENQILGFILGGNGIYNSLSTAYNAGTGVVPSMRKQKFAYKLYEYLIEIYKKHKTQQAVLEVIKNNQAAINLYQSLNFRVERELICFTLPKILTEPIKNALKINIQQVTKPDFASYFPFQDFSPTWQNSDSAILRNLPDEVVLEAYYKTEFVGFIIFEKDSGKISRFGVRPDFRKKHIGYQLFKAVQNISLQKKLSIINIDSNNLSTINFLQTLGFQETIRQFEMYLTL